MPKVELKAATVRHAKAAPGERLELWDTLRPGFGLRVTDRGNKTYFVTYRLHGRKVRQTLGEAGTLTLGEARQAARDAIAAARNGQDPRTPVTGPSTFADLCDRFLRLYAEPRLRPSSLKDVRRAIEKGLKPEFGHRAPDTITRSDVVKLLDGIAARAPYTANRTRAVLSKVYKWAMARGEVEHSPVSGVEPPGAEKKRDRTLTDKELARVWHGAEGLPPVFRDFFRVLILTGQRRGQVAGMRWQDLDLKAKLWHVPADDMKSGRPHTVPLSAPAANMLADRPRSKGCEFVFTTTGKTPISGFSKAKTALETASKVSGWRIHDLRRTVATGLASVSIPGAVIAKVLDHADHSVTAIYNRYDYLPEKRMALDKWARHVTGLKAPKR